MFHSFEQLFHAQMLLLIRIKNKKSKAQDWRTFKKRKKKKKMRKWLSIIQQNYKFFGLFSKIYLRGFRSPCSSGPTTRTCMTPPPRHRMSDANLKATWQRWRKNGVITSRVAAARGVPLCPAPLRLAYVGGVSERRVLDKAPSR